MNKHIDVWTLTIIHTYYGDAPCTDFRFRPTPETVRLMTRRGLFARSNPGQWRLAAQEDCTFDVNDRFVVDVCCVNPWFAGITETKGIKPLKAPVFDAGHETRVIAYHAEESGQANVPPTVVARMVFEPAAAPEGGIEHVETELRFQSTSVVFEYIVLPKGKKMPSLQMRETTGKLTFMPPEPIDYMGKKGVIFVAEQEVRQAYQSDLKIQVLEAGEHPGRIIVKAAQLPEPGAFIDVGAGRARAVVYV